MLDDHKENFDSNSKLVPRITISHNSSEVFCVRFSPDGEYVVAGGGDGSIRCFNAQSGGLISTLQGGSNVALPITSIRFRPITTTSRAKNVFLTANTAGVIQHWHLSSGKNLHTMNDDENNQVYAMDYDAEGAKFCTAGKDTAVRVYDEATKTLLVTMRGGLGRSMRDTPGHSNRVFTAKFYPNDENIIVTGGWDNTVQFWDVRKGGAIRSIFGPHICGDALDIVGNTIVTGSWRNSKQLEIWDFPSGEKITDVNWSATADPSHSCMLYAAQFSKEGKGSYVAAGGSGVNEVRVFDSRRDYSPVGTITGLARGVFSIDFAETEQKIAIGCGDATLRIVDIVDKGK